jgi:toxin ParE1/3/4
MRVLWTIPALRDLDQIQDFIAHDSPIAAHKLATDLMRRTDKLLAANPKAGRTGRAQGTRELVISGTPYIVVYRVRDLVEVVAVVHGAREWPDNFN